MNVSDAIEKRRSIRRYKPDDVPEQVLMKVLNAARLAPSGCAREARKLIVVRDIETKRKLAAASPCRFPGPNSEIHTVGNDKVANAPVVIVGCNLVQDANMRYFGPVGEELVVFSNRTRKAGMPEYWDEYLLHSKTHTGEYESMGLWDLAIALDHLSLAAVEEGLGTCWIGVTDEREIRKVLAIPPSVQARMIMILGYPDVSPDAKPRKPLEEVVCFEEYS
jgi:nitroreductase